MTTTGALRMIGVEEELLLVDSTTFCPTPAAGRILDGLAAMPERTAGPSGDHPPGFVLEKEVKLEKEAKLEQIEVVSPPLKDLGELFETIRAGRRAADVAARAEGARAVAIATGTLPGTTHLSAHPRFEQMRERFGLTMEEQLTCGYHVHVSIASEEEGVAVLDRLRPWLPIILALSANSPYWQGIDTGFASYRYQAWGRWPLSGSYDRFGSVAGYRDAVDEALAAEVPLDAGMVYFDARLSRHAPTVETRIADVCLMPEDAAVIAALVRGLVETSAADWRAGSPADDVSTSLLRLASWRASKSGLGDILIDPRSRQPVSARHAVGTLLAHVAGHFADDEEERSVRCGIERIIGRGTGADRQRGWMRSEASFPALVRNVADASAC